MVCSSSAQGWRLSSQRIRTRGQLSAFIGSPVRSHLQSIAILVAALIVAAALVFFAVGGQRYTMSTPASPRGLDDPYVFVLDRLTGQVRKCDQNSCAVLGRKALTSAERENLEWLSKQTGVPVKELIPP